MPQTFLPVDPGEIRINKNIPGQTVRLAAQISDSGAAIFKGQEFDGHREVRDGHLKELLVIVICIDQKY